MPRTPLRNPPALHALFALTLLAACSTGGGDDAGSPTDAGSDAGSDAGRAMCSSDPECDDGHPCTDELCVVGNVCEYTAFDSRCAEGERCVIGRGCVTGTPTDCTSDTDCDDGDACNGAESCLVAVGMCVPGDDVDCSDGNACTDDSCNPSTGACSYQTSAGCDGGAVGQDAGPMCDDFDPETHYSGTLRLLPPQSCGGGGGSYNVNSMTFSRDASTLTVTVGPFTLTGAAPTGPTFTVTGSNSCASVTLTGTFECSNLFRGSWSANHSGGCAACGSTNASVTGVRQ